MFLKRFFQSYLSLSIAQTHVIHQAFPLKAASDPNNFSSELADCFFGNY